MWICLRHDSITNIVCIPSSRQPCVSSRPSFNELEFTSCICLSSYISDIFYSSQDTSISVQNSSHCSFLASMAMVLRVTTTSSVSPYSSSTISKTSDTVKRKIPIPKPPITQPSCLGVIKQSEIKSFRKTLQTLSQNQDENLLKKSMMQNGTYTLIGVIEGRLIFLPLLQW